MKQRLGWVLFACVSLSIGSQNASAHCQVPCGIYNDHARIHEMYEDIVTVRKATSKIIELAKKDDPKSKNQLVRWVVNKEKHAENIIRIVSDYFLTQKIKPATGKMAQDYLKKLSTHHAVMKAAMKAKQNADLTVVDALKKTVDGIAVYWTKKK